MRRDEIAEIIGRIDKLIVRVGGIVPIDNDYNYGLLDAIGVVEEYGKEESREQGASN